MPKGSVAMYNGVKSDLNVLIWKNVQEILSEKEKNYGIYYLDLLKEYINFMIYN